MVAPPEAPRNAKAAPGGMGKKGRGQRYEDYKGQGPDRLNKSVGYACSSDDRRNLAKSLRLIARSGESSPSNRVW